MSVLNVNSISNLTGGFGFRNRLINAQGLINQRAYVSGTATTSANQYTLDRWRVVTLGQNLTYTTSQNETTFTAPAGGVEQVIEGLNLETGTYVLSWTGTATATVSGASVANGGTVSVTGGTNTTVRFSNGTFMNPQFESGNRASTFERRPVGFELSLCQRYYEVGNQVASTASNAGLANSYTNFISFKVNKRVAPILTTYSAVNFSGTAGSWTWYPGAVVAATNAEYLQNEGFWISRLATSTYNLAIGSWKADAEL